MSKLFPSEANDPFENKFVYDIYAEELRGQHKCKSEKTLLLIVTYYMHNQIVRLYY